MDSTGGYRKPAIRATWAAAQALRAEIYFHTGRDIAPSYGQTPEEYIAALHRDSVPPSNYISRPWSGDSE